jgi:flagellar hook-basal body protein
MYISAEGAAAQSQRLEVIANNLANVDTAGFKQDVPTFQARFAEAIQQGQAQAGDQSINDLGGGVKVIDVDTDHSLGQLKQTGNDLDWRSTARDSSMSAARTARCTSPGPATLPSIPAAGW